MMIVLIHIDSIKVRLFGMTFKVDKTFSVKLPTPALPAPVNAEFNEAGIKGMVTVQ